ncbi:DNA-binding PadR family transcriptional regulator [Streptosporangium becharense]|uniref:DNA-binding PadR family transcriptional regulator n=1 Tax=Streptosporangium becharense TaxID=1816182 RepID=A0A7W9MHT2_9ACTN|nr:PadR family transcriptional regulator [Streptosporangium becharense]MBB2913882.1 DNA-binding PadR family transcriptional regulator [Streptosporangium becharense]MBB5821457.1 DNA-binding PadR family transcriptional regulator [Streptosporangium becharense]
MAIRQGLLALLSQGPRYGYQLRAEFEASTGATWPLNIGQVYTTLSRMERDGLVSPGEQDDQGRVVYSITEAGRTEMERWFDTPVAQSDRPRDELVIKLAMAVAAGADVRPIIRAQRTATMSTLQRLTRAKHTAVQGAAQRLVLDSMIFQAEAEQRWLDHCEAVLTASPRTQERQR